MYDELVKRLHQRIALTTAGSPLQDDLQQAADAIEELQATVEGYESSTNMAFVEKDGETVIEFVPKWIPVTGRLPEDGKFVLVCNDDWHMMIAKHETETYEWYYKYMNYDFDIWDNEEQGPVRYWIPLPEPPKEE